MTLDLLVRSRDALRSALRSAGYAGAPQDSLVDQALREGLALLHEQYPAQNRRFVVRAEALQDGTLLHLSLLLPDLRQLIALWSVAHAFVALDYLPYNGGASVLFGVADAPRVGDEMEATYRPWLWVEGVNGAVLTTLPLSWHDAWIKAAALCHARGEAVRTGVALDDSYVQTYERAVSALRTPVRPVSWNRGL